MLFASFEGHCYHDIDSEKCFVTVQGPTATCREVNVISISTRLYGLLQDKNLRGYEHFI